jgi:hypothetical protein
MENVVSRSASVFEKRRVIDFLSAALEMSIRTHDNQVKRAPAHGDRA